MDLIFFETPLFTRLLHDYMGDQSYRELQLALLKNPESGDVIPGTGGFRKLRWLNPVRGKGKRGGLRIIYYYLMDEHQVWFFTIFDKDRLTDLTTRDKRVLKQAIQRELAARRLK